MGNNLIHNYLNNNVAQPQKPQQKSTRNYVVQIPTVSSTIDSFDKNSDKLIKPLDGKGHLVNNDLVHMPKEFVRDTVYTTKAFADGVRGKANDHQLGKLNDLGLKMGGLAIATYLMTQKATPKTKAMEFIGFGSFLASMALWPKVALEIPARIVHGFNFRKQYIDDQGRKKFVSQDPNYIPFDLYKGDKKNNDLDVIGDRLGVSRNIPNRHEAIKEQMRKISVQNNTMWMMTAGLATPIMTALACNQAEKVITPMFEKMSNKKVNNSIDKVSEYLNGNLNTEETVNYETKVLNIATSNGKPAKADKLTSLVDNLKGKTISRENVTSIADTLADGFDAEMKDAAKADITNLIGGERYIANSASTERLANSIHETISSKDAKLAEKLTPEKIKKAASEGIIRGAVKDLLTSVGFDVLDKNEPINDGRVSTNFKCKEVDNLEFFKETPATKNMSPAERLAYNIKSIILKVNNSNPAEDFIPGMSDLEIQNRELKSQIDAKLQAGADEIAKQFYEGNLAIGNGRESYVRTAIGQAYKTEAPRGPKYDKLFRTVSDVVTQETTNNRGYVLDEVAANTIKQAGTRLNKYRAVDEILTNGAHFKTEKANETLVANNWEKVSNTLVKELNISDKEIKEASKSKELTNQLFTRKLEQACSNEESYKKLITTLAQTMSELDEKMDAPNQGSNGQMMNKIEAGITKNCTETGNALGELNLSSMQRKMSASRSSKMGVNTGSIMNAKLERLHSRVDGVHSSYMRLLQTCEFFHRANAYEQEVAQPGHNMAELAKKYGMSENHEMNKEVIARGKKLLLDAHTDKFYNKMGTNNNPNFFKTLMWSVFRPNNSNEWYSWGAASEDTVRTLDNVTVKVGNEEKVPRRVFENAERKPLGQKLKEYMNMMYNSFGSIERKVIETGDALRIEGGVNASEARASRRFDLLGKAPSDLLHDTLKQKYNTNKWTKMFAPVLAATFAVTVGAQFLFGKKDPDIKA